MLKCRLRAHGQRAWLKGMAIKGVWSKSMVEVYVNQGHKVKQHD